MFVILSEAKNLCSTSTPQRRCFAPISMTPVDSSLGNGELLLDHKADVDAKDTAWMTPLHWAAEFVRKDVAELLLAHNATVNAKDEYGRTPLHMAALFNRKDVAELLLAHGADVNAKDKRGKTPLGVTTNSVANDNDKGTIELLKEHGAK